MKNCSAVPTTLPVRTDEAIESARQPSWLSPVTKNRGTSMGNALRSILVRLVAYVAVTIAAGLLFLAGATVCQLMWPRPVVPRSRPQCPEASRG